NAQLIETAIGEHVWAERYDRRLADVFVVQDELVDRVVGTVASQLRRREGERALAAAPETLDAYALTMRARVLIATGGKDNTLEARRLVEQAITRDQGYAQAYAQLVQTLTATYANRWNEEFGAPSTLERIAVSASQAVQLAPDDPTVRAILAIALAG